MKRDVAALLSVCLLITGCATMSDYEKVRYEELKRELYAAGLPERQIKNPAIAGLLNILPGIGNLYLGQTGPFLICLLFWPASAVAGVPQAVADAKTMNKQDTLLFYELGAGKAQMADAISIPSAISTTAQQFSGRSTTMGSLNSNTTITLPKSQDKAHKLEKILALRKTKDNAAIPYLIEALADEEWVNKIMLAEQAALTLSEYGAPAVEPLLAALGGSSPVQREFAARALGLIGDDRAVDPLIGLLDDKDSGVRADTARALGRLENPKAIPALRKASSRESKLLTGIEMENSLAQLQAQGAVAEVDTSGNCYELGYRYGRCGTLALLGKMCPPKDDFATPVRCRGTDENMAGLKAGTTSVYQELGLPLN